MKNTTILIGLIMIAVTIGSANAITPISLDVNLLEDGANIDTSKLVTIYYNTDDASTPPNPLPVSINTVDDLDPVEGPIYLWGLYDSSYDPCTSGSDCKSKLCASFVIFSAGTDIIIQVEGYEDHTFSGVTSSVGPMDVDLTPTGTAPPSTPTLNDPGTTDTDGSYTVSWSSVSGATSYTLEEDTSGSFGSPTVVYSGSGTSTQITGRGDGTYYYRVKACNACGCSGWSNVEDIEVSMDVGGWNKTFGGTDNDVAYSVQQTSDGGFILAGYTNSYGAGSSDFWLVKTDSSGNKQWDKTFGGADSDIARSVQQTSDGGYILAGCTRSYGAGSYDAWLVRINSNGDILWHAALGGTGWDVAESVQQTSDGGFIFTGYTGSYGDVFYDAWLVKVDCNGCVQWNTTFGGFGMDVVESVQQTSDGGYIIAGSTPPQGSYLFAAGFMNPLGVDFADAWLVKIDSNGNKQWDQTFGGADWDTAESVQQTSDGGFILAGYTKSYGAGDPDFWLIKTYSNGIKQWDKTFGETDDDYAYSVQQTSDGGYILTGVTEPHSDPTPVILAGFMGPCSAGGSDVWLIKTDLEGGKEWDKTFGGTGDDYASSVQQTSDGGYVLAGYTKSYGAGGSDFWLMKVGGTEVPVPPTPTLNDPGTTDTDGSYTVSWSSVSGATNYTLEEDTSGSFGSPTVVYSGSGTSKYITGRSDGTYYYRVKACNACGCGGWSNVEDIEVEISNIIRVPEDYSTIQAAIDAASSGCTIHVSAGTYMENLFVYKPLTLIGEDKSTTVINGDGSEDIIRVTADGCTISGFTIQGSDDCDWEEKTLTTDEIWDLGGGFALTPVQIDVDGDKVWFSFTKGDKEFDSVVVSAGDTYTFTATIDGEEDVPVLFCYAVGMYRGTESTFVQIRYVLFDDHVQGVDTGDTAGEATGLWPIAGIGLSYADNNTLTNNEIRSCDCGIRLRYSANNNVITANIASKNNRGIVLRYSSNSNIIHHNNLINNTWGNAYDGGSANQWDFDAQGNHYSDYSGTDPDGDGIGNDPHHILGGSSMDWYPLMQPWGNDTPLKGDLNHDGILTPADATIALQLAATGGWDSAADVDGDNHTTSLDALMILQAAGDAIDL